MIDASEPLTRIRNLALAMPEATERRSDDGACAFLISGSDAFVWFRDDGQGTIAVLVRTTGDDEQAAMIEADPEGCYRPLDLGASGWIAMPLDRANIDWDRVGDRIAQSWELTAPARLLESGGR